MRMRVRAVVPLCAVVLAAGVVPARATPAVDGDSRSWPLVDPACTITSSWAQEPSAATATAVRVTSAVTCAPGATVYSVHVELIDESIPPAAESTSTSSEIAGFPVGEARSYAPPPIGSVTDLATEFTYRHPKKGHVYAVIASAAFGSATPPVGSVPCDAFPQAIYPTPYLTVQCTTAMTFTATTDAPASTAPTVSMPADQSITAADPDPYASRGACSMAQAAYKTSTRSWTSQLSQYCPGWLYLEGVIGVYADPQTTIPLAFGPHYVQGYTASTGTRRSSASMPVATPGSTATIVSYFVLGQVFEAPDPLPPECTYGEGTSMVFCELALNVRF
jgi:hypothetical protein